MYVYKKLRSPQLNVVGEVASEVVATKPIHWITMVEDASLRVLPEKASAKGNF
jgi:hypothetical protein